MKIIDRYVAATFLKNYLISFMVLVGLYVVLDMVFNFDELVEVNNKAEASGFATLLSTLGTIGDYYFYQTFLFFTQLSGIIPVVAAAFTLLRFSRFNELTALLAAGTPLLRVAMPILIASVGLNVLLVLDHELVIPRMIPKLVRKHDDLSRDGPKRFPIQAMQDEQNRILSAAAYTPGAGDRPPAMWKVDVIERDAQLIATAHTRAEAATWDGRRWVLQDGYRATGLGAADAGGLSETPVAVYEGSVTPDEIALYRSGDYVELLSTRQINALLARPKSYGTGSLARVKHWRFTQPLMNVILLMLAIPCVLTRDPGQLKRAATLCLALTGAAMATMFLFQQLAAVNPLGPERAAAWPALMAWMPIFLWGPISVWLLDRVKT
ncbi:MAG TPA: LptF/LptG family permease [Tepidisphaeraceae bacterium]|nr:LptF/LptG family permease [Tepidisphaeraceae bacterium]